MIRVKSPEGAVWKTKRSKRVCCIPVRGFTDSTTNKTYTLMMCAILNKPDDIYYLLDIQRPNDIGVHQPTREERRTFELLRDKYPISSTKIIKCRHRLRLALHEKKLEQFEVRRQEIGRQVLRDMAKKRRQECSVRPVASIPKEAHVEVKEAASATKSNVPVIVVNQKDIDIIKAVLQVLYFTPRAMVAYTAKSDSELKQEDTVVTDMSVYKPHRTLAISVSTGDMQNIAKLLIQTVLLNYYRRSHIEEAILCTESKVFDANTVVTDMSVYKPQRTLGMSVYTRDMKNIAKLLLQFVLLAYYRRSHIEEAILCSENKVFDANTLVTNMIVHQPHTTLGLSVPTRDLQNISKLILQCVIMTYYRRSHIEEAILCTENQVLINTRESNNTCIMSSCTYNEQLFLCDHIIHIQLKPCMICHLTNELILSEKNWNKATLLCNEKYVNDDNDLRHVSYHGEYIDTGVQFLMLNGTINMQIFLTANTLTGSVSISMCSLIKKLVLSSKTGISRDIDIQCLLTCGYGHTANVVKCGAPAGNSMKLTQSEKMVVLAHCSNLDDVIGLLNMDYSSMTKEGGQGCVTYNNQKVETSSHEAGRENTRNDIKVDRDDSFADDNDGMFGILGIYASH